MCLPNTIQESSDEAVGYTPASHRALILPKKFLATCTTSVPPTSSFPANKAASYAVTRLQLLFAARNPIPFPVGAQHCCAPASHNPSDSAMHLRWSAGQPLSLHQLTASWNLLPLFSRLQLFVFNSLQPLLAKHRGWGTPTGPARSVLPWHSACIDRGQYRFEAVQTRGKGTFSSSSFLLPCRPAHFPRRRRSLSWTLSRTIFGATCALLNVIV